MKYFIIVIAILVIALSISIPAHSQDKTDAEIICGESNEDCIAEQEKSMVIVYHAYYKNVQSMDDGETKTLLQLMLIYCAIENTDDNDVMDRTSELQCIKKEIKDITNIIHQADGGV